MNFPNLPTDNLYKFIAISGLVFLLISWVYPEIKRSDIKQQIIQHDMERNIIVKKMDYLKMKFDAFKFIDSLRNVLDKVSLPKDPLAAMETMLRNFEKTEEGGFTHGDKAIEVQLQAIEFEGKGKQIKYLESELERIRKLSIFGYILGSILTATGFLLWYFKLQRYQDAGARYELKSKTTSL